MRTTVIMALLLMACAGRNDEAPNTSVLHFACVDEGRPASEPPEGLTFTSANPEGGLVGAYRRGERILYFRARRFRTHSYFWRRALLGDTTPEYQVSGVQVLDRHCLSTFRSTGVGGPWQVPETPAEREVHQADMSLLDEAMVAMASARLPAVLHLERDALLAFPRPRAIGPCPSWRHAAPGAGDAGRGLSGEVCIPAPTAPASDR